MKRRNKLMTAVGMAGLVAVAMQLRPGDVTAADHAEAPLTEIDPAADIADFYAWHDDSGRLYAVLTFAGLTEAGGEPTIDADVLYTINIDDTGNEQADTSIYVRFGQNDLKEWGVRVDNLPGEKGPFEAPIAMEGTGKGGGRVIAGLFDDPFFFDLSGFEATLMSGDLMFEDPMAKTFDDFAGTNVTAIVLEMDAAAADANGDDFIQLWATTARLTPR